MHGIRKICKKIKRIYICKYTRYKLVKLKGQTEYARYSSWNSLNRGQFNDLFAFTYLYIQTRFLSRYVYHRERIFFPFISQKCMLDLFDTRWKYVTNTIPISKLGLLYSFYLFVQKKLFYQSWKCMKRGFNLIHKKKFLHKMFFFNFRESETHSSYSE